MLVRQWNSSTYLYMNDERRQNSKTSMYASFGVGEAVRNGREANNDRIVNASAITTSGLCPLTGPR